MKMIMRNTKNIGIIIYLDVLCIDDLSRLSSQTIAAIDIILFQISNININLGDFLIIFTMDHAQIKLFNAHPFFTSPQEIPCFRMVLGIDQ